MNLLSPVIGTGYSGLLPEIPTASPGQYEGLVYFGAGWLTLRLAASIIGARRGFVLPRCGSGGSWWAGCGCWRSARW